MKNWGTGPDRVRAPWLDTCSRWWEPIMAVGFYYYGWNNCSRWICFINNSCEMSKWIRSWLPSTHLYITMDQGAGWDERRQSWGTPGINILFNHTLTRAQERTADKGAQLMSCSAPSGGTNQDNLCEWIPRLLSAWFLPSFFLLPFYFLPDAKLTICSLPHCLWSYVQRQESTGLFWTPNGAQCLHLQMVV